MWNLILLVGVTILVSAVLLPEFRRKLFANIGLNITPNTDEAKVATAVLTVVTIYLASCMFGWTITIIGAAALFLYLHKADRDSLFNGVISCWNGLTGSNTQPTTPAPNTRQPVTPPQPPANNGTGDWLRRERDLNQPGGRPLPPVTIPRPVTPTPTFPQPNMGDILDSEREINRLKPGKVLSKGERFALEPTTLPRVICVHIGTDIATYGTNPLAVSCSLVSNGQVVDQVTSDKPSNANGSVTHNGANNGHITVDLAKLPSEVQSLTFAAISRDKPFRLVDQNTAFQICEQNSLTKGVCRYELPRESEKPAMVAVRLYRHKDGWKVQAIGETVAASGAENLVTAIAQLG